MKLFQSYSIVVAVMTAVLVYGQCAIAREPITLGAFSMAAAYKVLQSGQSIDDEIRYSGFITNVWAVLASDDDIIIVGERNFSLPPLLLDDVVVALRSSTIISTGENPGVSIEPFTKDEYSTSQKVIFFGGIENTHYGLVTLLSDYYLKAISQSYLPSHISGLPSEWDLSIDNRRAGRIVPSWEQGLGVSWIYPQHFRIANSDGIAVLTSAKMKINTSFNGKLAFQESYFDLDKPEQLSDVLEKAPYATSELAAHLFTQHYDSISLKKEYQVFGQLKNIMALSGLFSELLGKDSNKTDVVNYWMNTYPITKVETPTEVPTLSHADIGLGYSLMISGGIESEFTAIDGWSESVLSRNTLYLKEAAIKSRPTRNAVSWLIPIRLGAPTNWSNTDLLNSVWENERQRLLNFPKPANLMSLLDIKNFAKPLSQPNWSPSTLGNNLLSFTIDFELTTGTTKTYSPAKEYSIVHGDLTLGLPLTLQWIYANRFELSYSIPVVYKLSTEDRPTNLPGIAENIVTYTFGIDSPTLSNRIQLWDGVHNGRWKYPNVVMENSLIIPKNRIWSKGFIDGKEFKDDYDFSFGTPSKTLIHALTITTPLDSNIRWSLFGRRTDVVDPIETNNDTKMIGMQFNCNYQRHTGNSVSLMLAQRSYKHGNLWIKQGRQYLLEWLLPGREGTNRFSIGWFKPSSENTQIGGAFLLNIDLSGSSLWKGRAWF